jgi:hypothetical protein
VHPSDQPDRQPRAPPQSLLHPLHFALIGVVIVPQKVQEAV